MYWVTGFAYRRAMSTLKMPPTVVMDAKHPLLKEKEMLPLEEFAVAVIGRTSLPTVTGVVGWHSVWFAVVVEAVDVTVVVDVEFVDDDVEFVDDEDVEFVSPAANVIGARPAGVLAEPADWACAYAAIPPETRTSIAATVRIWSLPAFTCMLLRTRSPHDAI
jgi:hypothetical protein